MTERQLLTKFFSLPFSVKRKLFKDLGVPDQIEDYMLPYFELDKKRIKRVVDGNLKEEFFDKLRSFVV